MTCRCKALECHDIPRTSEHLWIWNLKELGSNEYRKGYETLEENDWCWGEKAPQQDEPLCSMSVSYLWSQVPPSKILQLFPPSFLTISYLSHAGQPRLSLGPGRRPPAPPADALPSPGSPHYAPRDGLLPRKPQPLCALWSRSVPQLMTKNEKVAETQTNMDHNTQTQRHKRFNVVHCRRHADGM